MMTQRWVLTLPERETVRLLACLAERERIDRESELADDLERLDDLLESRIAVNAEIARIVVQYSSERHRRHASEISTDMVS